MAPIQQHFLNSGAFGGSQSECAALRIRGPILRPVLEHAVAALVERHEILRSTISTESGEAFLHVHDAPAHPPVTWLELTGRPGPEQAAAAAAREFAEAETDPSTGPLLRVLAVRLAGDDHVLVLAVHHLVADATSVRVMVDELSRDYAAQLAGQPGPVAPPALQYPDFARWEREVLLPVAERTDGPFWQNALAGVPAALDLRTDRPRPPVKGLAGRRTEFRFDPALGPRLLAFARAHRATPYTAALAAFTALVHRSTGAADFVLGVLAANRTAPGVERLVGQFSNTVPLRLDLTGEPDFADLTARCGRVVAGAVEHSRLAFGRILELTRPERDPSRTPLIQHLFVPRLDAIGTTRFAGLPVTEWEVERGRGRFDTIVEFAATDTEATAWVEYDSALYTEQGIADLMADFEQLLTDWLADPARPLTGLALADRAAAEPPAVIGADPEPVLSAAEFGRLARESGPGDLVVDGPVPAADLARLRERPGRRALRLIRPDGAGALLVADFTGLPERWPTLRVAGPGRLLPAAGLSPRTPAPLHLVRDGHAVPTGLTGRLAPSGEIELTGGVEFLSGSPQPSPAAGGAGDALLALVCELWTETMDVPAVGPDDDFFVLGGHSMLAARLVENLRDSLGREMTVRMLFENPTPGLLTEELRRRNPELDELLRLVGELDPGEQSDFAEQSDPGEQPDGPAAEREPAEQLVPLLSGQRQLWLAEQLNPGRLTHTIPVLLRIDGPLDGGALRAAVADVVARQPGLRGVFVEVDGVPMQRIVPFTGFEVPLTDLAALPAGERRERGRALEEETAYGGFDIATGPLLRARLVRFGEREHVLHLLFHHLVTDEVSMTLFMRELSEYYLERTGARPARLPELGLGFAELAAAEQELLSGREGERLRRFWSATLAGAPRLELPTDRARPERPAYQGEFLGRPAPRELADAVIALAAERRTTAYTVFLTAVVALLHRLSGQSDFVVGVPTENRSRRGSEHLMGCFLNVLPVRVDCSGDPTAAELLDRVGARLLECYDHQRLPFSEILEAVRPDRQSDRHPVYQVTCELQLAGWMPVELPGCEVRYELLSHGTARYDLSFHGMVRESDLMTMLEIDTALWKPETGLRWIDELTALLARLTAAPDSRLSELAGRPSPTDDGSSR
ncbi:condensation domain-containing protein [Kitasatospora sp. NPDC059673]|uniref:condensation domain-containing protein n=1 Tax=Kitasatospora sp. NPDC059673 TaxID=3346901 RepID=UPI0036D17808